MFDILAKIKVKLIINGEKSVLLQQNKKQLSCFEKFKNRGEKKMRIIEKVFGYLMIFCTDQGFQERQVWVQFIIKNVSWIHHHIWTGVRIFGGFHVIYLFESGVSNYFTLLIFVLYAITDWFDGKVYRWRKGIFGQPPNVVAMENNKFGPIFDGITDKFFVLPVIWYLGDSFSSLWVFVFLFFVEGAGNIIIFLLDKLKLIKRGRNIYEHLVIGKIKFGLQVALVTFLWVAVFISPDWYWWKLWINLFLGVILLLAVFSIACKIDYRSMWFIADCITFGGMLCGGFAIYFAFFKKDFKMAAALVIISAVIDLLDGYVARMTKEKETIRGIYADDTADAISFGFAPAAIILSAGMSWIASFGYAICTIGRLVKFTLDKFRKNGKNEEDERITVFKGLPSPAAGVLIASVFLWNNPVLQSGLPLFLVVAFSGILEVIFPLRFYHFKYFQDFPKKVQFFSLFVFFGSAFLGMAGEGITIMVIAYGIFFFRPFADNFLDVNLDKVINKKEYSVVA